MTPADDFQGKAADLMKKVLTVGVGTLFLTEDALKSMISEFKLPKELLGGLMEMAGKNKTEFLKSLSKDVISRISDRVDPVAVIEEFLDRNEVEFTIKVSAKPRDKKTPKGEKSEGAEAAAKSERAEKPEKGEKSGKSASGSASSTGGSESGPYPKQDE